MTIDKKSKEILDALNKSIEENQAILGPAIEVYNLYPDYKNLFNTKAQLAYDELQANTTLNVKYFCFRVPKGKEATAAVKLSNIINDLADRDFIIRPLARLSYLDFSVFWGQTPETAVFSWPVLTEEGCAYVDRVYPREQLLEGQLPPLTE